MSFIDDLRKKRRTPGRAHEEFLHRFSKHTSSIHAFFEGHEDASFYVNFIDRYSDNSSVEIYNCGGKKEVYDTYDKLKARLDFKTIALFFVDKDWSDFLEEKWPVDRRIYVTEYYSIENYLVDSYMLRRVLNETIRTKVPFDHETIVDNFEKSLQIFYKKIQIVNIWLFQLKYISKKPNHKNINLERIFNFNNDLTVDTKHDNVLSELETSCTEKTPCDFSVFQVTWIRKFIHFHPKTYVRGKFELWFFVEYIKKLIIYLNANYLTVAIDRKTQLEHSNAIEILGPRAQIPDSLREFLVINLS